MTQIWNIFRKDCRQFWPEALVSLFVLAMFTWMYPHQLMWRGEYPEAAGSFFHDPDRMRTLSAILTILLPISWLLLITRVVQEEGPVGAGQFWVTRPYIWYKLLAEKLLFIAVFIGLPFLAAQFVMLHRAGFVALHFLPGLLLQLASVAVIAWLPMICLASVTSTLLRSLGVMLATAALLAAWAFFSPSGDYPAPRPAWIPFSDTFTLPLILQFAAAVLWVQYAQRRVWLGRGLLIALPLTLAAIGVLLPEQKLVSSYYPALKAGQVTPLTVTLDSVDGDNGGIQLDGEKYVSLRLPLKTSGIAPGHAVDADDVRVTIEAKDGSRWSSAWQSTPGSRFDDQSRDRSLNISMDSALLLRLQAQLVTMRIELAMTEIAAGTTTQVPYREGQPFDLPGVGRCSYPSSPFVPPINCVVPLHEPAQAKLREMAYPAPCAASPNPVNGIPNSAWLGQFASAPDFGLASVWRDISYYLPEKIPAGPDRYIFCPGTMIEVTPYFLVQRFQYEWTTNAVRLPSRYVPR